MPLSKAKQAEYMRGYRKRTVIPKSEVVIPKHPIGYQYQDGRVRLSDGSVVQPGECERVERCEESSS